MAITNIATINAGANVVSTNVVATNVVTTNDRSNVTSLCFSIAYVYKKTAEKCCLKACR